jgi:hypothetical protein
MKQQTAVEWLVNEIAEKYNFRFATYYGQEIQQAKEMEEQQKAEDWQLGYDACEFHNDYDELQREPMKNPYRNKK